MNTTLNKLIDFINENRELSVHEIRTKAQSLMPKEKEDLMNAYNEGYSDMKHNVDICSAENYFNTTFKQ